MSSLVRPFLAAGAHSVVANLWAADDQFSLSLMREFYRRLAAGADVADALRGGEAADAGAVRAASGGEALERRARVWRWCQSAGAATSRRSVRSRQWNSLSESQRRAVFEKVLDTVNAKFMGPNPDIQKLRRRSRARRSSEPDS